MTSTLSNDFSTAKPLLSEFDMMERADIIIRADDLILVTGASGFIGPRVIETLLRRGFTNLRCFTRPSSNSGALHTLARQYGNSARIELLKGNLLMPDDCLRATNEAALIYHLAAGRGEKSFADAYLNSVVTTRNLIESSQKHKTLKRFVSISSFSVYTNKGKARRELLDESCPTEPRPELRGDAYTFAKLKQDELLIELGNKLNLPYVIVRPGVVYGPGNAGITGRVGIATFGLFLHLGGANQIPFTYVDNCATAIVLAGLKSGIDREVFNVVDDGLPSSRSFLRSYKRIVKRFPSIYVPHALSYLLCWLWETYSKRSEGQLPPLFNRRVWHAYWKRTHYSNHKLKSRLGWSPHVSTADALISHLEACARTGSHA
jgi:nucleoside-diphosphate-sugar epimerase